MNIRWPKKIWSEQTCAWELSRTRQRDRKQETLGWSQFSTLQGAGTVNYARDEEECAGKDRDRGSGVEFLDLVKTNVGTDLAKALATHAACNASPDVRQSILTIINLLQA